MAVRQIVPKQRLQFDFPPEAVDGLDDMVVDMKASSRAEVMKRALGLLNHVLRHQKEGGVVELVGADGSRQRVVLL